MAGHAAGFLAFALLCAATCVLSQDARDFIPRVGARHGSGHLGQKGGLLGDHLLGGSVECHASCNQMAYENGTDCQGAFKIMCHGSEGTAEENTTFVTVIKCMGHWTEAVSNYSAYEPVGSTASCSGAVHQKTLACVDVDEQPVFVAAEYGCALNFSYKVVNNGEARNSSTVCQGVESVTEISSASPPDGDVTKENLQSMLEDVLPDGDSSNAPDSPDDQNVVDLQSLLDLGDVAITCNGQDTSLLAPCHGTLQIAVEGPKANTTESCKGWWFPVPAPGLIFACTGEWAVDASSAAGAEAQDCMGHTVLETRVSLAHGHHFRGARELCIGSSRRWGLAKAEHHWDDAPVAST